MNLNILLDTNIIISREDNKVIDENLQKLLNVLNQGDDNLLIHYKSYDDVKRDSDLKRREITISKMKTYNTLKSDYDFTLDDDFVSIVNYNNNPNDYVDNSLLYSLYKGEVSFLITEDKGIHRNARNLGIDNNVFSIIDAFNFFKESIPILPYIINKTTVDILDINDPIFDSLKKKYEHFVSWFDKIKREKRKCLIYENPNSKLGALLIYKHEEEVIQLMNCELPAINRIKIATMIVTSTGYKIGEALLNWIINYALENHIYELYLTHFVEKNDPLIYLIEEYGFVCEGKNSLGEYVYVKKIEDIPTEKISNSDSFIELAKMHYPNFYDGENVDKYIIPIKPHFHEKLFLSDSQKTLLPYLGLLNENSIEIQKHAIKKAYLSRSSTVMKKGDIVLFYESNKKGISEIGVVEEFYRNSNYEDIVAHVGKRSVYSQNELKKYEGENNSVLLFIHSKNFNKVSLNKLLNNKIIKAAPQSTQRLSHKKYLKLKQLI